MRRIVLSLCCSVLSLALVDAALAQDQPVRPVLECVVDNEDGTFTAHFGYLNENLIPVSIPVGPDNRFTPAPQDRGQTTLFDPGRSPFFPDAAFQVDFDGSPLVWTLAGPDGSRRTSTASTGSSRCPEPPADPLQLSICYRAKTQARTERPAKMKNMRLEDRFEDKLYNLSISKAVCTPAETLIDGELLEVEDPDAHQHARSLGLTLTKPRQPRFDRKDPANQGIQVTDRFGTHTVDLQRPESLFFETALCNPNVETCPPEPADLDIGSLGSGQSKCYRVRTPRGAPRFPKGVRAIVTDPFRSAVYDIRRPKSLCTAASVEGDEPGAPAEVEAQLCYLVATAVRYCEPGAPPEFALKTCRRDQECGGGNCVVIPRPFNHRKVRGIFSHNEYAPERMDTIKEDLLCVPAEIVP